MTRFSIREAAKAVGMTEDGIRKAIARGNITAGKKTNGRKYIEASELFRAYDPVQDKEDRQNQDSMAYYGDKSDKKIQIENDFLKEKITDLQTQLKKAEEREEKLQEANEKITEMADRQTRLLEHHTQRPPQKTVEDQNKPQSTEPKQKPLNAFLGGLTFVLAVCLTALLTYLFSKS